MRIVNSLLLVISGAAFGVGFVLSCGDNAPHSDAANCDCPASEPPIAGRVVAIDGQPVTIQPGISGVPDVVCDPGMQVLSGKCTMANEGSIDDVTLQQEGFNLPVGGWYCIYKNNKTVPVQVKASVLCLKPHM